MSLIDALNTVATPLAEAPKALRQPRVTYRDGKPSEVVTGDVAKASTQSEYRDRILSSCEVTIPEGYELQLVEAWLNTNAWTRPTTDQEVATTTSKWRYHFKVVRVEEPLEGHLPLAEVRRYVKSRRGALAAGVTAQAKPHAEVVCLADLQIGKKDQRGGTAELEDRFYLGFDEVLHRIKQSKPSEIVLAELGDGCEGFQNTPQQAHTNDRNLIAQLDMHSTFLTHAATELARLAPKLTIVGVPSNHMEVRENGKAIGGPDNDYGLLTLSQLKRAFDLNLKAFGHVGFAWPGEHEVSKVLNVAGTNVMFTHGHYSRGAGAADGIPKWLEHQFAADAEYHAARIIFTGHFHHLRIQQIIGGRWWLQAPALDNGSSWLKRINGQGDSDAGILVTRIEAAGWSNPQVLGNAA